VVEIEVVYEGGLHTECRHGPSVALLATDAPVDNHGKGEAFSPTDLVATGLGTCMLTVMGIVAERHGWPLAGAVARVEKHMVDEPVRRIGRLVVDLSFPAAIPETARRPLMRAAHGCPVKQSLHPDIVVEVRERWGQ
jgi:putative redox protein